MTTQRKNLPRHELKRLIARAMVDARIDDDRETMTMYQIACLIDRPPSTHLLGVLAEMVEDGLLAVSASPHRPGWSKNVFSLRGRTAVQPPLFAK